MLVLMLGLAQLVTAVHLSARPPPVGQLVARLRTARSAGKVLHPDQYSKALHVCGKDGHWREALDVLGLLEGQVQAINDTVIGFTQPGATTKALTRVMQACGRHDQWREAYGLLERMRLLGVPPDTRAYNAALSACAKAQRNDEVIEGMKDMSSHGVRPDAATFSIAINSCVHAGRSSVALRLFDQMGQRGQPAPDEVCYSDAMFAAARAKDAVSAVKLLQRMEADESVALTIEAATGAMTACSNADEHALALRLFERLERRAALQPDVQCCSMAISAHSRMGSYTDALTLFRTMRRRYARQGEARLSRDVICYNSLLHACALEPRRDLGARHAQRLRACMRHEGVVPNDVTYSVLLQVLWDKAAATAILDEAVLRSPSGVFARCLTQQSDSAGQSSWELDLHRLSPGAAVAMLLWLLSQLAKDAVGAGAGAAAGGASMPRQVKIITGWGKSQSRFKFMGKQRCVVRGAVLEALRVCDVPTLPMAHASDGEDEEVEGNPGLVELDVPKLGAWLRRSIANGLIRGYFSPEDEHDIAIIGLTEDHVAAIVRASQGQGPDEIRLRIGQRHTPGKESDGGATSAARDGEEKEIRVA